MASYWHTHRSALATLEASQDAVQDAQLRYRAGIAPLTELLLAQRDLQAARSAAATAIEQWNVSRAGLELETGRRCAEDGPAEPGTGRPPAGTADTIHPESAADGCWVAGAGA